MDGRVSCESPSPTWRSCSAGPPSCGRAPRTASRKPSAMARARAVMGLRRGPPPLVVVDQAMVVVAAVVFCEREYVGHFFAPEILWTTFATPL